MNSQTTQRICLNTELRLGQISASFPPALSHVPKGDPKPYDKSLLKKMLFYQTGKCEIRSAWDDRQKLGHKAT